MRQGTHVAGLLKLPIWDIATRSSVRRPGGVLTGFGARRIVLDISGHYAYIRAFPPFTSFSLSPSFCPILTNLCEWPTVPGRLGRPGGATPHVSDASAQRAGSSAPGLALFGDGVLTGVMHQCECREHLLKLGSLGFYRATFCPCWRRVTPTWAPASIALRTTAPSDKKHRIRAESGRSVVFRPQGCG